jgi:D-arabinose 1-dehydrogenase-like Zn-dependent alcohol dehydrogenase
MGGLAIRGKLIVLGVGSELIEINPMHLIFGSRTIQGEVVGTSIDEEDTLDFSALQTVRPMIERVALDQAAEAYAKMMRNEVRFRMVIDFSL